MKKKNMKFMRKTVCLFVLFVLMLGLVIPAYATTTTKINEATKMANELKALGLFFGTNNGYELERAGTRTEGLVMLLRLLGEASIAEKSNHTNPFTDVPAWANKSVAYGYHKGYTSGVSATRFGATDRVTAPQYITFILRALGYTTGYTWDNPYALAEKIGLMKKGEYSGSSNFIRADIVILSYRALDIKYNGQDITLRQKLFGTNPGTNKTDAGVFNTDANNLVIVDKNATYDSNLGRLNGMIFNTYGVRYTPGLSQNGLTSGIARFLHDDSTNNYGVRITGWRKSYDSNIAVNDALNAVLETFYFLSGDKDVALSLWKWFDDININGKSNTTNFGFTTVTSTSTSATIKKNGVEINIVVSGTTTSVYFK